MVADVLTLSEPRQLRAIAEPVRRDILEALRTADSAAGVARTLGRSRQGMNYHVKALHKAGLVVEAGTRRSGNFIEQLYQAAAHRFVVAPEATSSPERLAAAFAEQASLRYLAGFGERVSRDALALADNASAGSGEVPSATVESELRFADEAARSAFLEAYVAMLEDLATKYGSVDGAPFRAALVVYPNPEEQE